jgi:uncharacterized membrane-anchored protein YitT (DUF2179 family)
MTNVTSGSRKHTVFENIQGIATGAFLCAVGIIPLTTLGLITGQTGGLAVLLSYMTGIGFGPIFFAVNLPFYLLAYFRMGLKFTVNTILTVALVSVIVEVAPSYLTISQIHPLAAVLMFGTMSGAGLLAVFRHGSSLGGIGVLALYLQEKIGFKVGWTQLSFDATLFLVAAFVMPLNLVAWSMFGALILNLVIAINHRPDRYIGM